MCGKGGWIKDEEGFDDIPVGRDFVMERAKLQADREDAEEGRQERIRERLEAAFSDDDPDEACPGERIDARTSARRIADIAAMILQEAGGEKSDFR